MTSERKFITENIRRLLLKEFLMKETKKAGFGGLDIKRTPMGTRVTLIIERPGLVIGRKGSTIKALTHAVETDFTFDNPQIEVQEVQDANLNGQIMAERLASALERGWHFRRAGHSTVRRIMDSGAKGCQVILSGKLTGQRHRTEKFKAGHIKYCGEPKLLWMEEGYAVAKKKLGTIGVKVQIMDPAAVLPDEVKIRKLTPTGETEVPEKPKSEAKPYPTDKPKTSTDKKTDKKEVLDNVAKKAEPKKATEGKKKVDEAKAEAKPKDKKVTPLPTNTPPAETKKVAPEDKKAKPAPATPVAKEAKTEAKADAKAEANIETTLAPAKPAEGPPKKEE